MTTEETSNGFHSVARESDLPEGVPVGVALPSGIQVCLVRTNGTVHAFHDRCPHADYPMSDGVLESGEVIECALHGARFALPGGEVLEGPAESDLTMFEVKLADEQIWVRADAPPD